MARPWFWRIKMHRRPLNMLFERLLFWLLRGVRERAMHVLLLLLSLISVIYLTYQSITNGLLRTSLVFFLVLCGYCVLNIIFYDEYDWFKRRVFKVVFVALVVIGFGLTFLSESLFRNDQFFSSAIGYSAVKLGITDTALLSNESSTGSYRYSRSERYVYLINKNKADTEIPRLVQQHFGTDYIILQGYRQMDLYYKGNRNAYLGSYYTVEKADYMLLVI